MKYWVIWRTRHGGMAEVLCHNYAAAQMIYLHLCNVRTDVSMQQAQTVTVSFVVY